MMAIAACGRGGPTYCCTTNVALPQHASHATAPQNHQAPSLTAASLPHMISVGVLALAAVIEVVLGGA
jgi:hypothetical protein